MGCVSSRVLAKSGSFQEKGSLGHSFQRSSVIEEIILSSSKSNGDQFLALLRASNSTARKAKEPEQNPAAAAVESEPAGKVETINVSELLAGLEEENAAEQGGREDGDRLPARCVADGGAAGKARSFRTVEDFDALVTQGGSSERAAERVEPRIEAAEAPESGGGGGSRRDDPAGPGGEAEADGARRRVRARQLGELKVPAAFDFSKFGSLRDWLRQSGQTFSPGSYVTPKFGAAPAEHRGGEKAGDEPSLPPPPPQQEQVLFDPELVAQFERAMEQLGKGRGQRGRRGVWRRRGLQDKAGARGSFCVPSPRWPCDLACHVCIFVK